MSDVFNVEQEVTADIAEAHLRNGYSQVTALCAFTFPAGTSSVTMLQARNSRGRTTTGHIAVDTETFAAFCEEWLSVYRREVHDG
jgi:hypothetical protein